MTLSALAAAFALGIVLASSPGPVQAVLLAGAARGGWRRGAAAMLGANATLAALLLALAGGLALVAPTGSAARLIRLGGWSSRLSYVLAAALGALGAFFIISAARGA